MPATETPGKTVRPRKTAGRFRIKRIYEPASKDEVCACWSTGCGRAASPSKSADRSVAKDMSPSDELRRMVHADPAKWDEFVKAYGRELKQEPAQTAFADLRKLPRSQP